MGYYLGKYDVAVIGAGHAGCEAALAAARLGMKTALFTISLDAIANMPCNPSIGGTAKGHLVREIDSLGGQMGIAADANLLQSRMLNRGKGPAVHSLRAQIDRQHYHIYMKHILEMQENLDVKQSEIVDIITDENNNVSQVVTQLGGIYDVKAVIIATGTYLKGKIFVGDVSYKSGPDGVHAAEGLSSALERIGVPLRRFKTGTPARAKRSSIDFSKLERQEGDNPIVPFSYSTKEELHNIIDCYIAYTNLDTHKVITDNIKRSAMYGGQIEGVGPRYCPSIEDKIVRFKDKERHQVFVEPMGVDTEEIYLQGMSTSLPEDVQLAMYRSVKGFENIEIMRNAYAIEYDCCNPLDLLPTLEFKAVGGLYGAGQFNGTSGYEEAAAQGLVAGVNATHKILCKKPLILERSGSYIGTLIDDLVTKGCSDPYRMMTSRSEYRLVLRQDNADERLMPIGHEIGLLAPHKWEEFLERQKMKQDEIARLESVVLPPSEELNNALVSYETSPLHTGARLSELIRRPTVTYDMLEPFDKTRPNLPREIFERVQIELKYEGYIKRQLSQIKEAKKLERLPLPADLDYSKIEGLRLEAREKLNRVKPLNFGQASRISGVNPADISILHIYFEKEKNSKNDR